MQLAGASADSYRDIRGLHAKIVEDLENDVPVSSYSKKRGHSTAGGYRISDTPVATAPMREGHDVTLLVLPGEASWGGMSGIRGEKTKVQSSSEARGTCKEEDAPVPTVVVLHRGCELVAMLKILVARDALHRLAEHSGRQ